MQHQRIGGFESSNQDSEADWPFYYEVRSVAKRALDIPVVLQNGQYDNTSAGCRPMHFVEQFGGLCFVLEINGCAFELRMAEFLCRGRYVGTYLNAHSCLSHEAAKDINRLKVLTHEQDVDWNKALAQLLPLLLPTGTGFDILAVSGSTLFMPYQNQFVLAQLAGEPLKADPSGWT